LQELTRRALAAGGQQGEDPRVARAWLLDLARELEPVDPASGAARDGAAVRRAVEALLDALPARYPDGQVPAWLAPKAAYVGVVLRRLGDGLYHRYDVPGLPRTDNATEQFYRQLKAGERRATGHRRSDGFVVRVGGFAAYAAAASDVPEAALRVQLAEVPPARCAQCRAELRANQERQTRMRRFHLHPDRYLADLERRWLSLAGNP
jgi:hypothetical protein